MPVQAIVGSHLLNFPDIAMPYGTCYIKAWKRNGKKRKPPIVTVSLSAKPIKPCANLYREMLATQSVLRPESVPATPLMRRFPTLA
jgi:hypothetical protein